MHGESSIQISNEVKKALDITVKCQVYILRTAIKQTIKRTKLGIAMPFELSGLTTALHISVLQQEGSHSVIVVLLFFTKLQDAVVLEQEEAL